MLCDSNSAKYLKINSYFYILILKFLWKRNWKWVFEAIFCCYIYCEISIFCVCANFLKPLISSISCSSKVSNLYKNEIDLFLTIPFVSVFLYDYVWLFFFFFAVPITMKAFPRGEVGWQSCFVFFEDQACPPPWWVVHSATRNEKCTENVVFSSSHLYHHLFSRWYVFSPISANIEIICHTSGTLTHQSHLDRKCNISGKTYIDFL